MVVQNPPRSQLFPEFKQTAREPLDTRKVPKKKAPLPVNHFLRKGEPVPPPINVEISKEG